MPLIEALFRQLIRVHDIDAPFLEPQLALLLCDLVLDPGALQVCLPEPTHEDGVPQLGGDAEVLAAAHEGVGLAALDGVGELLEAEVGVFALGLGDEPGGETEWVSRMLVEGDTELGGAGVRARGERVHVPTVHNHGVLSCNDALANHRIASGDHPPPHRPKRLVQPPAILDLGQVDNAVRLDLDVGNVQGLQQRLHLLLRDGLGGDAVEAGGPVDVGGGAALGRRERRAVLDLGRGRRDGVGGGDVSAGARLGAVGWTTRVAFGCGGGSGGRGRGGF